VSISSRKDGHETMKKSKKMLFIAVGLIVAIAIGSFAFLSLSRAEQADNGADDFKDDNISVSIPADNSIPTQTTKPSVNPPAITVPDASVPNKSSPKVEGSTQEDAKEKLPSVTESPVMDSVVSVEKDEVVEKEEEKIVLTEEKKRDDEEDGNKLPEYKPSVGKDNPFDDGIQTKIDDKPVEDYVGEGEDRPGEGIHF
jgi:hypothetical protein